MTPLMVFLEVIKNVILFFSLSTILVMLIIAANLMSEEYKIFKTEKKEKISKTEKKPLARHSAKKIHSHRKGWSVELMENSKIKFS